MNDKLLARFRDQIIALRADIGRQNQRGADSQRTVELDQQAVGRLSRMDAMQHQAMARATQTRRDQMATRITAALSRIDDGEFGYCAECGEDISPKRLELDPTLALCIGCARS